MHFAKVWRTSARRAIHCLRQLLSLLIVTPMRRLQAGRGRQASSPPVTPHPALPLRLPASLGPWALVTPRAGVLGRKARHAKARAPLRRRRLSCRRRRRCRRRCVRPVPASVHHAVKEAARGVGEAGPGPRRTAPRRAGEAAEPAAAASTAAAPCYRCVSSSEASSTGACTRLQVAGRPVERMVADCARLLRGGGHVGPAAAVPARCGGRKVVPSVRVVGVPSLCRG